MQPFIEFRYWPLLLKTSWQAAVLIVLILALRRGLGLRLGPRWRYGLWLLVVVRLVLPGTVASAVSVFNFLNFARDSQAAVSQRAILETPGSRFLEPLPSRPVARPGETAVNAVSSWSRKNLWWLPLVWAAGALALTVYLVETHRRLARQVRLCRPLVEDRVMNLLEDCKQQMNVRVPVTVVETAAVDGPCLFGFLRPRLLLPPGFTRDFSPEELRFVFLHELGHIKRHDIPLGWLMAWLQILHWFNPLVWLGFSRMRMDREVACDALALAHADDRDRKPYGLTMVKLLERFDDSPRVPGLAGIVEDKQQMEERITMIATFQKTNRGRVLAGLLFIGLGLLTLTDAQPAAQPSGRGGPAVPKIVKTSPAVGAKDVDPALTEITVTFDQDMGGGMSWAGGGADFPKSPTDAQAKWRDRRTCVLPVKLEAARYYRVGINSTSYQNFRSAAGVSAMPSAIYFTTRGASAALQQKVNQPEVISFDPPNGAQNVSPGVTELRVTFNMPMGGGFSWCIVGEDDSDFPKDVPGKSASWTGDKKTGVLPVALKPGMTYRICLNAPEFKNFQSEAGVPLEPVIYTFKTSEKQ